MTRTKMTKRIMLGVALIVVLFATIVSAATGTFDITLVRGDAGLSASAAKKTDTYAYARLTVNGGNQIQGTEEVWYRVRNKNHAFASAAIATKYYGYYTLPYFSGYGINGEYHYLYAQLNPSNPYSFCRVYGTWIP